MNLDRAADDDGQAAGRSTPPLTNGAFGGQHPETGRFMPGNRAAVGRGNPHADRVQQWRRALVEAVSPEDLAKVVGVLLEGAKAGRKWACRELLDRCLGRPVQPQDIHVTAPPESPLGRIHGQIGLARLVHSDPELAEKLRDLAGRAEREAREADEYG